MTDGFRLDLHNPVNSEGALTGHLEFRAPTGRDFLEAGFPYKVEVDYLRPGVTTQVFDTRAIRLLLSRMAVVAPAVIDQLTPFDYNRAVQVIPYFLAAPAPKATSTSPSMPDTPLAT